MSERNTPRKTKGRFSRLGLPVSKGYLKPAGRGRLLAVGLLLAAVAAAFAALDFQVGDARHLSGGPLSSAHAVLQQDCSSCHGIAPAGGLARGKVADAACSSCHEKLGDDLGLFTFAAHYVYRSGDFERVATREHEMACASCHPEHRGADAPITQVADRQCLVCHEGHRFKDQHPAFDATVEPPVGEPSLAFAHGQHTREVMERLGVADVELACMTCHEPDAAGRGFLNISFDRHCDACHLEAGIATPRMPLLDPAGGTPVGVASLAAIRSGDEPGTQWSLFMDPNEFRTAGGRVMKTPLHHSDPWVLHNLRLLRRLLYPDAGLADLLVGTAEGDVAELYREAASTLKDQILGLRGSGDPAVQDQLADMEKLLRRVERALQDPSTPLDETEFLLAFDRPAQLDAEVKDEIELLIADLTQPCTDCHRVENATFVRINQDLEAMPRAEFSHRAHVIQRRCLDCHHKIPILDALAGPEADLAPEIDSASIVNLPDIESCRDCHQPRLASATCVTCHVFHPDKLRQASLLLYADGDDDGSPPADGE